MCFPFFLWWVVVVVVFFFPFSFCRGIRGLGLESRNLEVYEVAGYVSFDSISVFGVGL